MTEEPVFVAFENIQVRKDCPSPTFEKALKFGLKQTSAKNNFVWIWWESGVLFGPLQFSSSTVDTTCTTKNTREVGDLLDFAVGNHGKSISAARGPCIEAEEWLGSEGAAKFCSFWGWGLFGIYRNLVLKCVEHDNTPVDFFEALNFQGTPKSHCSYPTFHRCLRLSSWFNFSFSPKTEDCLKNGKFLSIKQLNFAINSYQCPNRNRWASCPRAFAMELGWQDIRKLC